MFDGYYTYLHAFLETVPSLWGFHSHQIPNDAIHHFRMANHDIGLENATIAETIVSHNGGLTIYERIWRYTQ